MRAPSNELPMRPLFRRLLLLFHALRYGARLLWLAAPEHHKLRWAATLVSRLHGSDKARASVHGALPQLGPLASAFANALVEHPELATGTLHDVIDSVDHMQAPLPPQEVERALEAAFGRPLATLFASVDLTPARNGFAEQTHIARLIEPVDGHRNVSIKLLRLTEVEQIGDEAAILRWVARWLEKLSGTARSLQLRSLAGSFTQELLRRFDLRAEAANLSQTGHHFDRDMRIAVPAVIWDLCTPTTLVVQRIDTLSVASIIELHAHHIKLATLAAHIVEVVSEQAFEHGFFHAALDAERVRVSIEPGTLGRLVLADFAIMSSLSAQERHFFVHGASALFEQEYGHLADLHLNAGHVAPGTRSEVLEAELRTRAEAHFADEPQARSAGALFHHLLHAVQPFEGTVSARLANAQRSFEQAETLARALHPGVDTWNIARRSLAGIARRDLGHRGWIGRISEELPHLAHIVPRMPQLAVRYLQHQQEQTHSQHDGEFARELGREIRRTRVLLWACAVGGAVLGAGAILLAQ
jgi:ubiquinone biosynthesis protein